MSSLFDDLTPEPRPTEPALPPVEVRDIRAIRNILAKPRIATGRKLTALELQQFRNQLRAWIREARQRKENNR